MSPKVCQSLSIVGVPFDPRWNRSALITWPQSHKTSAVILSVRPRKRSTIWYNVGKTIINHLFGNGFYTTIYHLLKWWWLGDGAFMAWLYPHYRYTQDGWPSKQWSFRSFPAKWRMFFLSQTSRVIRRAYLTILNMYICPILGSCKHPIISYNNASC